MSLFGAAYAAPNKGTTIVYWFRSPKQCWIPLQMVKFKDFSRPLNVFQYFSRQILFSRTFQDSPVYSSTFQACENPAFWSKAAWCPGGVLSEHFHLRECEKDGRTSSRCEGPRSVPSEYGWEGALNILGKWGCSVCQEHNVYEVLILLLLFVLLLYVPSQRLIKVMTGRSVQLSTLFPGQA